MIPLWYHEGTRQVGKICKRAAEYNNFLKAENHWFHIMHLKFIYNSLLLLTVDGILVLKKCQFVYHSDESGWTNEETWAWIQLRHLLDGSLPADHLTFLNLIYKTETVIGASSAVEDQRKDRRLEHGIRAPGKPGKDHGTHSKTWSDPKLGSLIV